MNLDLFGHDDTPPSKWAVLFSAKSDEWSTPDEVVEHFAKFVGPFTLDVCATEENAKAPVFFTAQENGLAQDWVYYASGGAAWLNPPYSDIEPFVLKALTETARGLPAVVCLLPSRTDRPWFHALLSQQHRCAFYFCRGRLRFGDATADAPFPSVVVVIQPRKRDR